MSDETDSRPDPTESTAPVPAAEESAPSEVTAAAEEAEQAAADAEEAIAAAQAAADAEAAGPVVYSAKQQRQARDVLTRLYAMRRAARFYPIDHPAVIELADAMLDAVRAFHEEGVDVHLMFVEDEVLLGEKILTEESVLFDQLIRDMTAIGVGSLTIVDGITRDELARAGALFGADTGEVAEAGGIERMVVSANIPHVQIGAVHVIEQVKAVEGDPDEEAKSKYGGAVSLMREMDRLLRANRPVTSARVKSAGRSLVDSVLSNRDAMLKLSGLKSHEEYTFYHSANVGILSVALGSRITNDYRFLSSLGTGALLHDIGKLSVDRNIIDKPGTLSPQEWENVRMHPVYGAEKVASMGGIDNSAIVIILEHHMRYDATGYPRRIPARPQHLASRIVAVADAYDAMTSKRSYSAARRPDEAMLMLVKSAGTALDPVLVRMFISLMNVYPPGSVVRLSSGEVAIVLKPSDTDPRSPLVRVIANAGGSMAHPIDVDLCQDRERSVLGCIDTRLVNIEVEDYV